jgi:hypothetical protein
MKRPLPARPPARKSRALGVFLLGITLWLTSPVWGQISTTIGSIVKGFSVPQHNDSGELVSKIGGTQADTVSPNRAVIKELVMEFYNKGTVTMKITSPKCDYWFLQSRLNTRDGVTIERDNMVITAQNFQWEEKEKKGVLQKNVSVTLKDFSLSNPNPSTSPSLSLDSPSKEQEPSIKLDLNTPTTTPLTPQETPTP